MPSKVVFMLCIISSEMLGSGSSNVKNNKPTKKEISGGGENTMAT